MATADATVRGAGVFGLAIGWACCQRGARVRVIDPAGPGAGASGGIVGALAPHVPEQWNPKKAAQLDSLLMAPAFWAGVEAASGLSTGYVPSGRLQPLADAEAVARAEARADGARTLWQGRATWQVVAGDAGFGWMLDSPTGLFVHDTLSAHLYPRMAVEALVAALRAKGAEVASDGPDEGAVVWATGYRGLQDLSQDLGQNVGSGEKGQAILLQFDSRDRPQLFVDGLHVIPHADGTTAIGSTSERAWQSPDPDDQLEALLARTRALVPDLRDAPVLQRWAGIRPRSRSRAPMIGRHPLHPGAYIANGGFKIGFGMAPLVADLMADLILTGTDRIPPAFRPEASLR